MPLRFWNAEKMDANLNGALEWKTLGSMDFMGFGKGGDNGIDSKYSKMLLLTFDENHLQTIVLGS